MSLRACSKCVAKSCRSVWGVASLVMPQSRTAAADSTTYFPWHTQSTGAASTDHQLHFPANHPTTLMNSKDVAALIDLCDRALDDLKRFDSGTDYAVLQVATKLCTIVEPLWVGSDLDPSLRESQPASSLWELKKAIGKLQSPSIYTVGQALATYGDAVVRVKAALLRLEEHITPKTPMVSLSTFKDHCVVDGDWLVRAHASKLPFIWHSKIQNLLELVTENSKYLDEFVERARSAGAENLVGDVAHHKRKFYDAKKRLDRVLGCVDRGFPALMSQLGSPELTDILRARALHTFAGAAALTLIAALQRFEGILITDRGGVVVRMFSDLPYLEVAHTPMVVLPYRHPVNGLAYGYEADYGLVRARIYPENEHQYEKVSLPRFEAEHWQDHRPGPLHLYFGWALPQWLVAGFTAPLPLSTWWISVLSDARSNERQINDSDSRWVEGLSPLSLPDTTYTGLVNGVYALSLVGSDLKVWVMPPPSGVREMEAARETMRPDSQVSDERLAADATQKKAPIVLCIAAAQVEFIAARDRFSKDFGVPRKVLIAGGTDQGLVFTDQSSGALWVLTVQSFQAEIDAALKAQRLVLTLKPHVTLMVGMCMGIGGQTFGTVVIPNEVRGFDHQRVTLAGTEYRSHGDLTDNQLYGFARIFDASALGYKVAVDKGLASASAKLEDVSGSLYEQITTNFPDAIAYDMEGWGFYRGVKAARGDGRELCLWIKGVADNGETQETTAEAKAAKKAQQTQATSNALDFAIRLMREYLTEVNALESI